MFNLRRSFSKKLMVTILLLAAPIFMVSLGILYTQSRQIIRKEAIGHANSMLTATMQRLNRNLLTIETATNNNSWLINQYLQPDSLLALTHRIVLLNHHIDGCSISTEPDVFPEHGKHFSVYTIRERDSIISVVELPYDYFSKVWYRAPRDQGKPCWVNYFDEADSLEVTLTGMVASYSKPVYQPNGELLAVISTDLSLLKLSKLISEEEKPYPNAYFMMLDSKGHFFIHPDSTRLFTQTIFTGADPNKQADLIALGHEMTGGRQGNMAVDIDGEHCLVCYQPVAGTSWSLALVCRDSDVLRGYYRLTYILTPILIAGLLVILLLCNRSVLHAIHPLNQLLEKTQSIALGNMEVYIPSSKRVDAVGRLQNSFASMLQSMNFHTGSIRYTTEQTHHRNEELANATKLVEEADRQKTAFIQNVSHQIRTPLNIIMGFAQILSETRMMPFTDDELASITETMNHNSKLLIRLVTMLYDSSDDAFSLELNIEKIDKVFCNDVVKEAVSYIKQHYPHVIVEMHSDVADDFCIQTNHVYLMRSLRELLYNAAKYSDGKHIQLIMSFSGDYIRFMVQDTGKGIVEADRERMFKFFAKVDDLSEGLGLGLPLAKRHAQNLNGDLFLDEDYHEGCRFILEVPIQA